MSKKKKVLCWSDSATAGTGFGVVSKHIIGALHATGKYDIHQLAINFHGDFIDKEKVPWQMQPARLLDPSDPHGMKMFYRTMLKTQYDIVWILNDLFVTHECSEAITKIREQSVLSGRKPPVFVYYYPVDCHVQAESSSMLDVVDIPVCYTTHGKEETLKVKPHLESKLVQIPHGVDSQTFYPLPQATIQECRKQWFGADPDKFVVVTINRNSTRKQIPYSLLAFKEFKKIVPNSVMYCHTMIKDQGSDLSKVISDLGLDTTSDVIFPARYSPATPASSEILNKLYNTGDLFLTTHLGEGWGLTVTEAMSAGVPVVSPNNTCMPEQLGENSERGYMYECTDWTWIDSSGFRPKGVLSDIVEQMVNVYKAGPKYTNPVIPKARTFAVEHDWNEVTQKWVNLFEEIKDGVTAENTVITQEV